MQTPLIDLETARALVSRGWSVVPTASDAEKRPQGSFATAKSWRDFSDRLPADAELLGWFGPKPRRGGVSWTEAPSGSSASRSTPRPDASSTARRSTVSS